MKQPRQQTLLAVSDVLASSRWYAALLGYEMLSDTIEDTHDNTYNRLLWRGKTTMQLHSFDDEEHPNLSSDDIDQLGRGVLLWFEVDDFNAAVKRARKLKAEIVIEPHINEAPGHHELWILDPDGYHVVISGPDGSA